MTADRFEGSTPPTPWRVIPAIPGSPEFIRAADDKTVASQLRSPEVAQRIVRAVNLMDAWQAVAEQMKALLGDFVWMLEQHPEHKGHYSDERIEVCEAALARLAEAEKTQAAGVSE